MSRFPEGPPLVKFSRESSRKVPLYDPTEALYDPTEPLYDAKVLPNFRPKAWDKLKKSIRHRLSDTYKTKWSTSLASLGDQPWGQVLGDGWGSFLCNLHARCLGIRSKNNTIVPDPFVFFVAFPDILRQRDKCIFLANYLDVIEKLLIFAPEKIDVYGIYN